MGMEYVSEDGKMRAGRAIGAPCHISCWCECTKNFDTDERLRIHRNFWNLTKNEKHDFYGKFVERGQIKRKRVKEGSRRECSFQYYFQLGDRRLQVCQKFFRNTLGIRDGMVYRYFRKVLKKETESETTLAEWPPLCELENEASAPGEIDNF